MSEGTCGHACSHGLSEKSCISRVPIFNHLEEDKMEEISALIESLSYRKGELVYQAGESSDALYIISQGRVKILQAFRAGERAAFKDSSARRFYRGAGAV